MYFKFVVQVIINIRKTLIEKNTYIVLKCFNFFTIHQATWHLLVIAEFNILTPYNAIYLHDKVKFTSNWSMVLNTAFVRAKSALNKTIVLGLTKIHKFGH